MLALRRFFFSESFFGRHFDAYLAEAGGLFFFMLNAGMAAALLEDPGSWLSWMLPSDFARRCVFGVWLGLVVYLIAANPLGKRSGAHINPAVTWAIWRLKQITSRDAVLYVLFQFAGGLFAAFVTDVVVGPTFRSPDVHFATSRPGEAGIAAAFAGEFAITAILIATSLIMGHSKKQKENLPWVLGLLVCTYVIFESPLSGMSMNPARSTGSAIRAGNATDLWIYFAAPMSAAIITTELYQRWRAKLSQWITQDEKTTIPIEPS